MTMPKGYVKLNPDEVVVKKAKVEEEIHSRRAFSFLNREKKPVDYQALLNEIQAKLFKINKSLDEVQNRLNRMPRI